MDGDVTDAGKRQSVRMTREATLLQSVCVGRKTPNGMQRVEHQGGVSTVRDVGADRAEFTSRLGLQVRLADGALVS